MARSNEVTTRTERKERMDWVDIIKATSVVLVVLLHVTQSLSFAVDGTVIAGFWNGVMTFLEPLRMPVFFIVSGILASSAVKRPWAFTKARTIGILYLYLLWHTLLTWFAILVDLIAKGYTEGMVLDALHDYFFQIFLTPGGYWYFYALVLYFVLARLLRNVNPWLVLGVAASLNLARPLVSGTINELLAPLGVSNMMAAVVMNAVYFLAGVYLVQFFKDYALRNDSQLLVGTATVAILGSVARLISPQVAAASFLPIAIAWVLTAILVAVRLQNNERVVAFGRYVGPRTLPIFVIQFVVLDVVYTVLGLYGAPLLNGSPLLQLLYPILLTLAITVLSLWIYDKAIARRGWRRLFKAPEAWTAKPAAAPAVPAERDDRSTGELPALRA
jgi:uncharacterized membrane protein YcfT